MYKWCLIHIGGYPEHEATQEALVFCEYEPPEEEYRWLVFHDEAWHWAMLEIYGNLYWLSKPELLEPSAEYGAEYKRKFG
ncbi:MAG: hypothetical protein KDE19_09975 [Caldilineaceae bacterium]|nr:hypothetical protein [Caldilineaceae bacterium]